MDKSNNYTDYLISATDDNSAAVFASENSVPEDAWFRLPSTLEDSPELFKKESTLVLTSEEWKGLSKEAYEEKSLRGQRNVRVLFAADFYVASKYAAARNWGLHSWKFVADPELEEVIEYGFFC